MTPVHPATRQTRRFRVPGLGGPWLITFRTTSTSATVLFDASADGGRLVWRLSTGRHPSIRCFLRQERSTKSSRLIRFEGPAWDLTSSKRGFRTIAAPFEVLPAMLEQRGNEDHRYRSRRLRTRLLPLARALAHRAVELLDPQARRCACRFRPDARFRVYSLIASDPSGRILRVADSCPGLVVALDGLMSSGGVPPAEGEALLAAIARGAPESELLDQAARATLAPGLVERWCGAAAARHLARLSQSEFEHLLAARRLLISHAGALVSTGDLFALPLPHFLPEDIPTKTRSNARWFAVARVASTALQEVDEPDLRTGLSAFLSAHALSLRDGSGAKFTLVDHLPTRDTGLARLIGRMVRYSRLTGKLPEG